MGFKDVFSSFIFPACNIIKSIELARVGSVKTSNLPRMLYQRVANTGSHNHLTLNPNPLRIILSSSELRYLAERTPSPPVHTKEFELFFFLKMFTK